MKTIGALLFALAVTLPATAQEAPYLSFRPLVMIGEQQFSAANTFKAVLGQAQETFWGGGVSIIQEDHFYLDLTASQFKKTGQRVFRDSSGDILRLGIPVRTTITPFEMTGGYRFHHRKNLLPYVGGGLGIFRYQESSDFSNDSENVDTRHIGYIVEAGLEIRLHRWIGTGVDVHYTIVPGILGADGLSRDLNETSLGGLSARFKVLVGR